MKTSRPLRTEAQTATPESARSAKPVDRRLFGLAEGARSFLAVTVGFGLASAVAVIAGAVVLAAIISDIFLGDAAPADLIEPLLLLGLIFAARGVFEWGRSVAAHRASATVKRSLRGRVMRSVLMQTAEGRPAGSGDLALTASTGIDALDAYFSHYLPQLVLGSVIPLLATFNRRYPGIRLSLSFGNSERVLQDLIDRRSDVAVLPDLKPDPRLHAIPYRRDRLIAFVERGHPWARSPKTSPAAGLGRGARLRAR